MRCSNARAIRWLVHAGTLVLAPTLMAQQAPHFYQQDFPAEEFVARRARVVESIGDDGFVLMQGAAADPGFRVFRQSNEFYYLTGLAVPHAYLLLDGQGGRSILFLAHRNERMERSEGKTLSAEDAELVTRLTGVDEVWGLDQMGRSLFRLAMRSPAPKMWTMLSPAEGRKQSRDENLIGLGHHLADPFDGRPSREGQFVRLMGERYPQFPVRDLSPTLDAMRLIKSEREIALVRRASELAGLGILEAMRSTKPGVMEYQLDAAARYIYLVNGAQGEGYRSITATGTNAYHGHYYRNQAELQDGELVLMDHAPDYRYYTSDIARMWPVNGRFSAGQRALYDFIVRYSEALIKRIRPGVTPDEILDGAAREMEPVLESSTFENANHEKAAREALAFRGHLSHPVGLAVHDVGRYRGSALTPGLVFAVDPMLWVHEERLYVRMEDVVVVTEDGVENFTDFLPKTTDEIETAMKEPGILDLRPPNEGVR